MDRYVLCRRLIRFGICLAFCLLLPLLALAEKGTVVDTASLRLRKSPSTSADIIGSIPKGTELELLTSTDDWYKVKYNGKTGYVMSKYIKKSGSSKSSTKTYTDKPTTNTLKPGASGDNVRRLQTRLKELGYYKDEIDGKYGDAVKEAVKKYQRKKGLYADGICGKDTMSSLYPDNKYGKEADVSYKTEQLDWFSNVRKIPKGATFDVKDCLTGRVFRCKRWSGANHMDTEPLTKEDTAIMLQCYGGKWSWNRRPVLVKYNGHVYAGSMNGMPHGTTTISYNNFDGHFCIHFYQSKTHGTKRVDQDHQNAVKKAMKYTW